MNAICASRQMYRVSESEYSQFYQLYSPCLLLTYKIISGILFTILAV